MVKILSQAGISLADVYDVVGSVAGIEQLESREVSLVHEMGGTLFSERFSTTVRRSASGDLAQSVAINLVLTDLPNVPARLLAVAVISDDRTRIAMLSLSASVAGGREIPVWVWDAANSETVRLVDNGAAVAQFDLLTPNVSHTFLPSFVGGTDQPQIVNQLALRGFTTGFGAGTVFVRGLYYIAFAQIGGISSKGLPIPSW